MTASWDRLAGKMGLSAVAVCAVLLAVTALALLNPGVRRASGLGPAGGYAAGERLDVTARVYEGSPQTLVLFVRSDCSAARSAQPFFANLAGIAARRPGTRMLMVVNSAGRAVPSQADLAYAQSLGLDASQVLVSRLTPGRIPMVPALVLVDHRGTVLQSWNPPQDWSQVSLPYTSAAR